MMFGVRGVQVGSKNRSKIDQNRRSTWEGILASIFDRFWWILGSKLASKIEQKSIQEGIEKVMKKRRAPRWILMCFLVPSWNGKWTNTAYQKAFKKRLKKEGGGNPAISGDGLPLLLIREYTFSRLSRPASWLAGPAWEKNSGGPARPQLGPSPGTNQHPTRRTVTLSPLFESPR